MNTIVPRGLVIALVVLFAACESSGPTAPTGTNQLPTPSLSPRATNFPPLSGPSRIFAFDRELSYLVRDYTEMSRFVLYDSGAFALQYPSLSAVAYRGRYTDANGAITFEWEGWSSAGPWGATGTLKGDSLTVQYNFIMQMTDFDDAEYVLVR